VVNLTLRDAAAAATAAAILRSGCSATIEAMRWLKCGFPLGNAFELSHVTFLETRREGAWLALASRLADDAIRWHTPLPRWRGCATQHICWGPHSPDHSSSLHDVCRGRRISHKGGRIGQGALHDAHDVHVGAGGVVRVRSLPC